MEENMNIVSENVADVTDVAVDSMNDIVEVTTGDKIAAGVTIGLAGVGAAAIVGGGAFGIYKLVKFIKSKKAEKQATEATENSEKAESKVDVEEIKPEENN